MRVIENSKFLPNQAGGENIVNYISRIQVEVEGHLLEATRELTPEEYSKTFPLMRDHFHEILKKDIMKHIEKMIFVGGAK